MEYLIELIEGNGLNSKINIVILIISIIATVNIIKFYISEEGRDERGKIIFGKSSFFSIITYIIYFVFINFIASYIEMSEGLYQFCINSTYCIFMITMSCSIKYYKNNT
ncbi:MAG: hypothetical protein WAO56_10470 [Miniphocaeibacter sp.]|uniref:hypothetical protein n=1 Tax=Miniphocaeibacter sp. TaxID=3100973 RepID=UPI00185DDFFE|nr:hypothetical protein [Gallicola sp.]